MNRSLDDTVENTIKGIYGDEVGEKLFQIIKSLSPGAMLNVRKQLEEAVKDELGEEQAAKIDYNIIMQWISIG